MINAVQLLDSERSGKKDSEFRSFLVPQTNESVECSDNKLEDSVT